ncbi:MAG TPA: transcription factor [Methanoregulaceae archaeon]|nr:transcription factor [Methanoregulaceae archaeon]HQJ87359.1 transcription factor [Methanoregulaceae archaeon]
MVAIAEIMEQPAVSAYLHRLIGNEGLLLIERFPEEGEFSDEDLSEVTQINLNSVRHTLYTLYERRLAEYRRIKNNETGWLTYLWRLRLDNIPVALAEEMESILEKLRAREQFEEENDFFRCAQCGVLLTFNQAVDDDFGCPECGSPLSHFDNEILLQALRRRREAIAASLGHG